MTVSVEIIVSATVGAATALEIPEPTTPITLSGGPSPIIDIEKVGVRRYWWMDNLGTISRIREPPKICCQRKPRSVTYTFENKKKQTSAYVCVVM